MGRSIEAFCNYDLWLPIAYIRYMLECSEVCSEKCRPFGGISIRVIWKYGHPLHGLWDLSWVGFNIKIVFVFLHQVGALKMVHLGNCFPKWKTVCSFPINAMASSSTNSVYVL